MTSIRVPTFLLVVAIVFAAWSPASIGQTRYRLASYPVQDNGNPASPRLSGQDPAAAFDFSKQDNQDPAKTNDPIVIDPSLLGQDQPSLPPLPQLEDEREPDQKVVVREKFAGWKQAGLDEIGPAVSDPLRGNWIMIGSTGQLKGTVFSDNSVDINNLPVYLLENGNVVVQTRTDEFGDFTFNNVEPGCYSLVGFGDLAFFAFGFNAVEFRLSQAGTIPGEIRVQASENKTTINLDWIRHFSPNVRFRVLGRHTMGETADDPVEFYGLAGLSEFGPESVPATSISGQEVVLTDDGSLVGRIHQINSRDGRPVEIRSARVMLLANNEVVAATDTNNYGVFRFPGIAPGHYNAVAVSSDGLGSIGISVVNNSSGGFGGAAAPQVAVDFCLTSVETTGWLNHMAVDVAYLRIASRPMPPSTDDANKNCEACNNMWLQNCMQMNSGFGQNIQGMNSIFDTLFYGDSSMYPGTWGECGCNSIGCGICQPMYAPGCGQCGQPGCNHVQPYLPGASTLLLPPGQAYPYDVQPNIIIIPKPVPGELPSGAFEALPPGN